MQAPFDGMGGQHFRLSTEALPNSGVPLSTSIRSWASSSIFSLLGALTGMTQITALGSQIVNVHF